ncbi:glycosyltransferase family 4 protein [Hymenobacter sp. 5317J-9]|uniref:glycosyltransferase family 4 protein n=1 Tax=Hymenobacter sp. 5317J-9 TaxID=2932250 RepID=UPI001FD63DCB|nr:glycosyltransferase family 4 protein [Hymenobacter sp. 5317J-9]UOQ99372.1 glycosyltransferase family 4 protein [Hymenobacter sp. 5317J-9]
MPAEAAPDASTTSGNAPTAPSTAENAFAAHETAAFQDAEDTSEADTDSTAESAAAPATPGIRRVDTAATETAGAIASLLIGLAELPPATTPAETQAALPAPSTVATPAAASARSQWPTGAHAPQRVRWVAPAAPYLGASAESAAPASSAVVVPVAPLVPASSVREAADLAQAALSWPAGFSPLAGPAAPEAEAASSTEENPADNAEMDNEAPAASLFSEAFDEPTEEIGAAEAQALNAPEDNLTPDAPALSGAAMETETGAVPAPEQPAEPAPRVPALDGLNFRMIQYARQAAQLVHGRTDFEVIYAPNWPAWLAALEIRNRSRLPLVLYAAGLTSDLASAEGGWLLEVERMALRRARLVLVPSEAVRRQLLQQYGPDVADVRVVAAHDEEAVRAVLREVAAG